MLETHISSHNEEEKCISKPPLSRFKTTSPSLVLPPNLEKPVLEIPSLEH